jgi:hypothetical protein
MASTNKLYGPILLFIVSIIIIIVGIVLSISIIFIMAGIPLILIGILLLVISILSFIKAVFGSVFSLFKLNPKATESKKPILDKKKPFKRKIVDVNEKDGVFEA